MVGFLAKRKTGSGGNQIERVWKFRENVEPDLAVRRVA